MAEHSHDGAVCIWCGLDYDFDLPETIVTACKQRQLVIFAGAGVSTEVSTVFPMSLYDEVIADVEDDAETFPAVMSAYEATHGRAALFKIIKKRFDFVDSFPKSRRAARQFHRELATMPFITDIITTNWDTYFEEECFATPFVVGEDIAFADLHARRVFKIHGSISTLGSVVVTEEDYAETLERLSSNVLGAHVRALLSSRTVVFVGYSLTDWNFVRLYGALLDDMGKFAPAAYFVSPHVSTEAAALGLTQLKTTGMKFVSELKASLIDDCIIPDDGYELIAKLEAKAWEADEHAKGISHADFPAVIFCWSYLDGLTDACFRIRTRRGSGEYSDLHRVQWLAHKYVAGAEKARTAGRFEDCAYMEGYANALVALLSSSDESTLELVPTYFVYGSDDDITSEEEFQVALEQSRRRAPKQRAFARNVVRDLPADMVLEHSRLLRDL